MFQFFPGSDDLRNVLICVTPYSQKFFIFPASLVSLLTTFENLRELEMNKRIVEKIFVIENQRQPKRFYFGVPK